MSNKFEVKNYEKLDNPQRRKMLPPERVLRLVGINKGSKIADVGCGIGYFTIPMAKVVGDEGHIYGIDISPEMIEEAGKRVMAEGLKNVELITSAENGFMLESGSVDMVFTSTVFHELDKPDMFLDECKRILNRDGVMVIIDWTKITEDVGPPVDKRIAVEEVEAILKSNKFSVVNTAFLGNSFYILTCKAS